MRGGRRHHEPRYGAVSVCVEGTAPAGSWIRRRSRRATGRRRAGKRRIELSLNENFVFEISTANCVEHFVFLDGGEGEPTGIECEREQVRRSWPSELRRFGGHGKPQQEDGTRRPTTGTHIIIMRAAIVFFLKAYFFEAVVQHVTYVSDFCRVCRRVVYPSRGTTRRNFQFSGTGVVAALQPVK